ncbi:22646_t:CDS:10 [Gigaspora margarita]|uniref:22646_t:CDS:1 n=1 Tax=Gigaspora margarita TaxID=4874 RepID=A0ABN7V6S3_GIGMA|nr:22646_t:CDS:10 [Gigaspora margarita]
MAEFLEFPVGYFYIKSATSPLVSSTQNLVVDFDRPICFLGFNDWTIRKVIIARQRNKRNNNMHNFDQLWSYEDGFLINKELQSCLEPESVKAGSRLYLQHRKIESQAANQKWVLTKEGHIKLKDKPFMLEVRDKYIVLTDISSKILASQFIIMPLHPVKKGVPGVAIGVVRLELICAEGLLRNGCYVSDRNYNSYVQVYHAGNYENIIAKTKVINDDPNPVNIIFEARRYCRLEITNELVKEVSEGIYEGTPDGIDVWRRLSAGRIHYKAIFFPLEPLPRPTPEFLSNLEEKPLDRSTFYVLITLQAPNGGFPPSVKLANLFGYVSQKQLLKLYKSQCCEERILKINPTVWTTSMILWFLHFLLNEYKSEWGYIYYRAEQFISKEIADLEIEESVVATSRKAVRERFDITETETISITHVRHILKCQQNTGAYPLTDDLARSFGYENTKKLQTTFNTYKNTHSKSQKINPQIWSTIMVLYFYRYVAIDQKKEWYPTYERSYRWLWAQLKGNESDKQECFKIVSSFIKDYHDVKDDIMEMDHDFENEIAKIIPSINNPQEFDQKPYGIARIEIISAKNLSQTNDSNPYVKISNLATSWIYDDTRVIYNNCNPVWEQVFYIPVYNIHENLNLQIFNYNALLNDTLLGFYIFDLKSIINEYPNNSYEVKKLKLDVNLTYEESNNRQLSFVADFFSLSELEDLEIINTTNVSIRHLYLLMAYQNQYGYFELTNTLARLFNFFSKKELIKTFSDFVQKDEKVCSLDNKIWGTLLVTSFLKVLLWKERCEWISSYNRAENWLNENVTDLEIEERLFNYSNKFVIQHFKVTQWIDETQQRSVGVLENHIKSLPYDSLENCEAEGTILSSNNRKVFFTKYNRTMVFHKITFSQIYSLDAFIKGLKQYRKVELHENILKFIAIFKQSVDEVEYLCEYAYDRTLCQYLNQNFHTINWKDKLHFAKQIVNAIIQGKRESAVFGTPKEYVTIYTKCWQYEQSLRPTVQNVYTALTSITYNNSTNKKIEVKYNINHKLDTLNYFDNWQNEVTKELKLISLIISTLKKTSTISMAETLNGITEINQRKILNLSSLPALNITPFAPLNNANIKRNYNEQKFLYDLNQIFISQFNIQGISENTTCSIIYHIKKYINSHDKKPDDIFNQYCNNKYKYYFTSIIGFFYEYGIGTVVNYYMAYDMYNQAVKDIYLTVTTNKQDNSLLTDNLLKENQCQVHLAEYYLNGIGTSLNKQKAFKYYKKSANQGSNLGQINLSYLSKRRYRNSKK